MNSYQKLCTEFYDTDKPDAPEQAFAFYLPYAEKASGPILEPMCGSGRYLLPLLGRGFDIDGTDASPSMLEACRNKAKQRDLSPNLYEQFLHELDVPRKYALVLIPAGSFALLTDPVQVKESLKRIHDVMLSGATLLLETGQHRAKDSSSWPWGGRWITCADGSKLMISWLGRYDANTGISHSINRYEKFKNGKLLETEYEEFDLQNYDAPEFRPLLEDAGFKDIQMRKAHGPGAPDETDEEIVWECTRP